MRRARRVLAAAGIATVALAGFTACGAVQLAMAPPAGCVIPGTSVTVPSMSGARFGGAAHSCVDGTWVAFNPQDNQR